MGGQNHQPCNKIDTNYLLFSTMMSRAVSDGRSNLECANIALEDALLMELRDSEGSSLDAVQKQLVASDSAIADALGAIAKLRADMLDNDFEDLPTLQTTDIEALGIELCGADIVSFGAWDVVSMCMAKNGFHGMLDHFCEVLVQIKQLTESLYSAVLRAETSATAGTLNKVLEENQQNNFKVEFAQLYTVWNRFQSVFLASSMLSTELWYRYCQVGVLLNKDRDSKAA